MSENENDGAVPASGSSPDASHAASSGPLELEPERLLPEPEPEEKKGRFWKKLKKGLFMTHTEILERIDAAVEGRAVLDEETLEHLEEALIGADIGVETALELVESVRSDAKRSQDGDLVLLRERLVDEMAVLLLDAPQPQSVGDPSETRLS